MSQNASNDPLAILAVVLSFIGILVSVLTAAFGAIAGLVVAGFITGAGAGAWAMNQVIRRTHEGPDRSDHPSAESTRAAPRRAP